MAAWKVATACALIGPNLPSATAPVESWMTRMALELKRLEAVMAACSPAGVSGPGARARTRRRTLRSSRVESSSLATARWATAVVPLGEGAMPAAWGAVDCGGGFAVGDPSLTVGLGVTWSSIHGQP